ncbi:hypothetical protein HK405_005629, partial [Cladochytrium tenue]
AAVGDHQEVCPDAAEVISSSSAVAGGNGPIQLCADLADASRFAVDDIPVATRHSACNDGLVCDGPRDPPSTSATSTVFTTTVVSASPATDLTESEINPAALLAIPNGAQADVYMTERSRPPEGELVDVEALAASPSDATSSAGADACASVQGATPSIPESMAAESGSPELKVDLGFLGKDEEVLPQVVQALVMLANRPCTFTELATFLIKFRLLTSILFRESPLVYIDLPGVPEHPDFVRIKDQLEDYRGEDDLKGSPGDSEELGRDLKPVDQVTSFVTEASTQEKKKKSHKKKKPGDGIALIATGGAPKHKKQSGVVNPKSSQPSQPVQVYAVGDADESVTAAAKRRRKSDGEVGGDAPEQSKKRGRGRPRLSLHTPIAEAVLQDGVSLEPARRGSAVTDTGPGDLTIDSILDPAKKKRRRKTTGDGGASSSGVSSWPTAGAPCFQIATGTSPAEMAAAATEAAKWIGIPYAGAGGAPVGRLSEPEAIDAAGGGLAAQLLAMLFAERDAARVAAAATHNGDGEGGIPPSQQGSAGVLSALEMVCGKAVALVAEHAGSAGESACGGHGRSGGAASFAAPAAVELSPPPPVRAMWTNAAQVLPAAGADISPLEMLARAATADV